MCTSDFIKISSMGSWVPGNQSLLSRGSVPELLDLCLLRFIVVKHIYMDVQAYLFFSWVLDL